MNQFNGKRILQLTFVFIVLFVPFSTAHAGIFDGFNTGSSGIFGNIGDRINSIFSGRDVDLGGAVTPYSPAPPVDADIGTPPPPGAGEFIKTWVEWDTFYRGIQPDDIETADPLAPIHKEYITDNGCCADCGEVVIESPCDYCDLNVWGRPHRGFEACSQCLPPINSEPPIDSIYHATIEHTLWGWCGGPGHVNPLAISRTQGEISSPPTESPGPNENLLEGSIPNKMIRRDGYAYKCLKIACSDETLPTPPPPWNPPLTPPTPISVPVPEERWNYIEFQTLIYHSNDFILTLHIQNYGDKDYGLDQIRVFRYAEDGREWPHNMDIRGDDPFNIFTTSTGMHARLNKHGNSMLAHKEPIGNNLFGDDSSTPEIDGQHKNYYQYDPDTVRSRIPSVPIQFGYNGSNIPRDFNFICDKNDGSEGERCPADMANYSGDDAYLLLERPLTVQEFRDYFFEYRDVSPPDMGGCGYNASSNNSVIGPITYQIEYGGNVEGTRFGRSVLNVSIPVGNPVDSESIPFGWPTTGRVQENWGNTSYAQELGQHRWLEDTRDIYDNYLYCPGEGQTYPLDGRTRAGDFLHPAIDIERATYQIKPPTVYTTHAGWVTFAGVDPAYPDKGYTVQVETDINHDKIPDVLTRYANLMPNSINIDIRNKSVHKTEPITNPGDQMIGTKFVYPFNTSLEYGAEESMYVPRNYLLGIMGDSGSPGNTHLNYEIVYANDDGVPPGANGNIGRERCSDNPYQSSCFADYPGQEMREGNFFARHRYYPELVLGNLFVNP